MTVLMIQPRLKIRSPFYSNLDFWPVEALESSVVK